MTLFKESEELLPKDGSALYQSHWLAPQEAQALLLQLQEEIHWKKEKIQLFGKEYWQPRLIAWYGDVAYSYSGKRWEPEAWHPKLLELKQRLEQDTQSQYNSVLLNWYRDGSDSMGWHSDDEPELGREPCIASLSLGATRRFFFRHRQDKALGSIRKDLESGSLLVMKGKTQDYWQHRISKTTRPVGSRINLTFRWVTEL